MKKGTHWSAEKNATVSPKEKRIIGKQGDKN